MEMLGYKYRADDGTVVVNLVDMEMGFLFGGCMTFDVMEMGASKNIVITVFL